MRKTRSIFLSAILTVALCIGCGSNPAKAPNTTDNPTSAPSPTIKTAVTPILPSTENNTPTPNQNPIPSENLSENDTKNTIPKYVFLFIGDGMTYPQFQLASSYLGANTASKTDAILTGPIALNFMCFDEIGSVTTYNSSSFCPDSASTATSIASGFKTYSGVLNMDETKTVSYTTIAEQLRDNTDYKIGIITSVNLNHATPAAFYAHQASRSSYYEIGLELVGSSFDYFAGGGLLRPTGSDGTKPDLYALAQNVGYTVIRTQEEAQALSAGTGRTLIVTEHLADSNSLDYEIDRKEGVWSLADYVLKGVELLDNENGFFLMCEGGKIDWACHANDAGSAINDVLALADAVQVAVDFAKEHPNETLILVTGDHETGGLSIGFAGTDYDTYLNNIRNQKISYAKYDADYVEAYKKNNTSFEEAMSDVQELFGLVLPENAKSAPDAVLVLTPYEVDKLKEAYSLTLNGYALDKEGKASQTQEEYIRYGKYTPFSVTVTHLLNNKSGINFSSYAHTGLPMAVFAQGVGAEIFSGSYDNTDIHDKLCELLGLENLAD